ncbi:MAG: NnrU family protein [Rhodospirillales bacterium]|nr:MAG: NnrU family protein [Rhodospirillales bacterium]
MILLLTAIAFFLAAHILPALPVPRAFLTGRMGERGYLLAYGLLSLLLLGLVADAYAQAPRHLLWETATWMRHATLGLMLPTCLLLVIAVTTPNPYSIGIGARGFDPLKPGPLRLTRHPLLHALGLWAGAHLIPNGDAESLVLFGFFLALALAGFPMMTAKRRHPSFPKRPLCLSDIGIWRIALALVLYAALLWAHPHVIGVNPLG